MHTLLHLTLEHTNRTTKLHCSTRRFKGKACVALTYHGCSVLRRLTAKTFTLLISLADDIIYFGRGSIDKAVDGF